MPQRSHIIIPSNDCKTHLYYSFYFVGSLLLIKENKRRYSRKKPKSSVKKAELISKGFTPGVIQKSTQKEDCIFTIQVSEQNKQPYFLDPINLDETYKKNGLAVFFKYRALRMMNRCQRANPVEIQEMQTN